MLFTKKGEFIMTELGLSGIMKKLVRAVMVFIVLSHKSSALRLSVCKPGN